MKYVLLAIWAVIIINLVNPLLGTNSYLLTWLGIAMLAAHFVEYFVFSKKIKAKGDGPAKSFLMTMVFGLAYFQL